MTNISLLYLSSLMLTFLSIAAGIDGHLAVAKGLSYVAMGLASVGLGIAVAQIVKLNRRK